MCVYFTKRLQKDQDNNREYNNLIVSQNFQPTNEIDNALCSGIDVNFLSENYFGVHVAIICADIDDNKKQHIQLKIHELLKTYKKNPSKFYISFKKLLLFLHVDNNYYTKKFLFFVDGNNAEEIFTKVLDCIKILCGKEKTKPATDWLTTLKRSFEVSQELNDNFLNSIIDKFSEEISGIIVEKNVDVKIVIFLPLNQFNFFAPNHNENQIHFPSFLEVVLKAMKTEDYAGILRDKLNQLYGGNQCSIRHYKDINEDLKRTFNKEIPSSDISCSQDIDSLSIEELLEQIDKQKEISEQLDEEMRSILAPIIEMLTQNKEQIRENPKKIEITQENSDIDYTNDTQEKRLENIQSSEKIKNENDDFYQENSETQETDVDYTNDTQEKRLENIQSSKKIKDKKDDFYKS